MDYPSLKIEDPLPLENRILSDGPDSLCIYRSKYDVATYREKSPHLSYDEKIDLIKNMFVPEKNISFPETIRSFKYEWLLLFSWLCYSPSEDASYCLSCFFFGDDFPTKASPGKDLHSPSGLGQVLFLTLKKAHYEGNWKLILHINLFKAFIFQHGLNLKLFFLKSKAQVMKLICYVIENIIMRLKKIEKY